MVVSKKVVNPVTKEGEYREVGKVAIPVFSLAEFGLATPAALTDTQRAEAIKAPGIDADNDDGLDMYADASVQFVYDAVVAATKADARNKLVSGTANLKAGNTIAQTVAELIAKAERSGAALALNRDFLTSFSTYLAAQSGKSAAVQAIYNGMVKVRASITLSTEARKQGLIHQLEQYINHATVEDAAKYTNIINTLGDLCQADVALVDDSEL